MSERALKRLVVQLAATRQEDIDAVLARLQPAHRRTVRAMLDGRPAPPASVPQAASDPGDGLSPWLKARVRAATGTEDAPPVGAIFAMTATAAQALAAAAADPAPTLPSAPLPRRSKIEQMRGRLIRPRVAT